MFSPALAFVCEHFESHGLAVAGQIIDNYKMRRIIRRRGADFSGPNGMLQKHSPLDEMKTTFFIKNTFDCYALEVSSRRAAIRFVVICF